MINVIRPKKGPKSCVGPSRGGLREQIDVWKNDNATDLSPERAQGLVTPQAAAAFFVGFLVGLVCFNSCQKRCLWELDCLTFRG